MREYYKVCETAHMALVLGLLLIPLAAVNANDDDSPVGVSRSPLVGGATTAVDQQERLGLISLNTGGKGCSGTLLLNDWALTAAHCIEDDSGRVFDAAMARASSTWGPQTRTGIAIITFRPADIALVQFDRPFVVNGSTTNVARSLDRRGVYREDIGKAMAIYGRGISIFAMGSGTTATPSASDGFYRDGKVILSSVAHGVYSYNSGAVAVAGGDSGGPTIRLDPFGDILGVHSQCQIQCAEGHSCGAWSGPGPEPTGYSPWEWVSSTLSCTDVSVHPYAQQITDIMRDRRLAEAPRMVVETTGSSVRYIGPTIQSEHGVRLRMDYCREPGANCGEPAAAAFCRLVDASKPIVASFKQLHDAPPTAIISSGQACREAYCDSFESITCGAPVNQQVAVATPGAALSGLGSPNKSKAMVTEHGSISSGVSIGKTLNNAICATGYVWREARPGDLVCVTPEARDRVAAENRLADSRRDPAGAYGPASCISGFVWREAFNGDVVCVTPASRAGVREENRLGPSRRAQ